MGEVHNAFVFHSHIQNVAMASEDESSSFCRIVYESRE